MNTVGERIKAARLANRWTLRDLSDFSGISNPFLCQVENGSDLSTRRLLTIAAALGVDPCYLLTGGPHGRTDHLP